ncbi:hypothetical protein, partial [Pseudonocardia sp. KRD291]|uniref:hypothetical protein n=1 Tax=Pseudonocardia sp. KRD291 TaxID=2792007 RepID=UPI001C4A4A23
MGAGQVAYGRARVIGFAAVLAVTVAGCGGSDMTAEQWTDQMCGAVLPFVRTATTPPPAGADPAATTRGISDYLGRSAGALDGTLDTLARLGPAPVDDGEAVGARLRDSLTEIRTAFTDSKTRVDALDTNDPAALEQGLPEALSPVSRLQSDTALAGLTSDPELSAASQSSANCRSL